MAGRQITGHRLAGVDVREGGREGGGLADEGSDYSQEMCK